MHDKRTARSTTRHRLILVREQDAQHSGSGCCGRLGERHTEFGGAADFSANRARMETLGRVYCAIAEHTSDVAVTVLDPRNWVALYPMVWRDARTHGASMPATLRAMTQAGAPGAVVLDGTTLFSGALPEAGDIVDTIMARLSDERCLAA